MTIHHMLCRSVLMISMAVLLAGCGFYNTGERETALAQQNAAGASLSLYEALALSLQHQQEGPGMLEDSDPLRQAWQRIDHSLAAANPQQAAERQGMDALVAKTRSAYLRAVTNEHMRGRVEETVRHLDAMAQNMAPEEAGRSDIARQIETLRAAYEPFATARRDLAALIGADNPEAIVLEDVPLEAMVSQEDAPLETLERTALLNRPEQMAVDNVDTLLAQANEKLPVALSEWDGFSSQFGEGLSRILGMDLALDNPAVRKKFDDLRTQAVSIAIVAQVRLAYAQIAQARDAARQVSETSDPSLALRADLGRHQAMIALQDARDLLNRSVGAAPIPRQPRRMVLAALSEALYQRDLGQNPESGTVIAAMQQEFYQHPDVNPVAFHPVDSASIIPLPRKIAVQESAEMAIFHPFGLNPRTLDLPGGMVRALLEAPVIEP